MSDPVPPRSASDGLDATCRLALLGTVGFTIGQVVADIRPTGATLAVAVGWSLACFVIGSLLFLAGFLIAAGRSRDEQVTLAGLVWLTGAAPDLVARVLRWCLIAQVVVALATAAVRPFTALAFGILAPMFGLGCLAWWAARHGVFTPIAAVDRRSDAAAVPPPPRLNDSRAEPGPTGSEPLGGAAADRNDGDRSDPDDFDQLFRRRRRRT